MSIFSILADFVATETVDQSLQTGERKAGGMLDHLNQRKNEKEGSYDSSKQKDPTLQKLDKIIDYANERDKQIKKLLK